MRRAVTLLELLIVLSIIIMVTAAAIPIMAPAIQNRRLREASRLVSTFISGARARAIETGHPVGVMFERQDGQPYSMRLSYVEVPQPYSGDSAGSTILVSAAGSVSKFVNGDIQWNTLVKYGDMIRLNYRGPLYQIASAPLPDPNIGQVVQDPSSAPWTLVAPQGSAAQIPASYFTAGCQFQIFRQPVRSSSAPMQLPEGTVIDLIASSGGTSATTPSYPVSGGTVPFNPVFTFTPSGALDYSASPAMSRPTSPLFFLIGKRELMSDVSKSLTDENVFDAIANEHRKSFWVAVAQGGRVTVAEQASTSSATDYATGRQFVQAGQSAGR